MSQNIHRSTKYQKTGLLIIGIIGIALVCRSYFHAHPIAVLTPRGPIAAAERHLIYEALGLSLFVVIPVFAITFWIAWKYRAGQGSDYRPDWDGNGMAETIWWVIPTILIVILSRLTWTSTHQLDPYKPIASTNKQITIQVVALDWKWLFIYPDQHVATVNYLKVPVNVPVQFDITSDAPMNSFWIPQLGGQIYAMPGMVTQLHLMASQTGAFYGSSANISGSGFAGMHFMTYGVTPADYQSWLTAAQHSQLNLSNASYTMLAKPSSNVTPQTYRDPANDLFSSIVDRYMAGGGNGMAGASMASMGGM